MLLALLVGAPLSAAQDKPQAAGPFDLRSFTCPLGGAKFNQDVGYSAYPLLTLPDGSWIGDFQIGTQVPVCPGNGLVLIPDFDLYETQAYGGGKIALTAYSPAELARLPALIADPEYRALKADGPYAQAWWLASKLDRSAYGRFHLLQRSTWPTRDPLVRRRLVERFAAEAPALIEAAKVPEAHRFELYGFVINALRELGQFDQARDLLRRVNMRAAALPAGPDQAVPDPLQTPIGRAIAQRDDGWFAAETMPAKLFGGLCRGELSTLYGPVRPATKAACKLREDRETRAERDEQMTFDESSKLKRDPAALSAACAKTAQPQRGVGLAQACDELQFAQDRLAADRLAQDGPALAAACAATPVGQRSGALYQACSSFDIASTSALETVLLDDPEAFAVLCPKTEIEQLADAMQWAALACGGSARGLLERAQDKLLLDLPVLDARCATLAADDYREPALNAACFKR